MTTTCSSAARCRVRCIAGVIAPPWSASVPAQSGPTSSPCPARPRGRHRAVVVDERAVDVEPDQQPLPGEAAQVLLEAGAGRLAVGGGGGGHVLQRAIGT